MALGALLSALGLPKWEGSAKMGMRVYTQLIHVALPERLTQHCKATVLR